MFYSGIFVLEYINVKLKLYPKTGQRQGGVYVSPSSPDQGLLHAVLHLERNKYGTIVCFGESYFKNNEDIVSKLYFQQT